MAISHSEKDSLIQKKFKKKSYIKYKNITLYMIQKA